MRSRVLPEVESMDNAKDEFAEKRVPVRAVLSRIGDFYSVHLSRESLILQGHDARFIKSR